MSSPVVSARDVLHRLAGRLGVAGGLLGMLAGAVQAVWGDRIPRWTGDKLATGSLGLLTIGLSLLATAAAARQHRAALALGARAGCALTMLVTGLLCFSTTGRLWWVPGPLLLLAGVLTVDSVPDTARLVAAHWLRCLLGLLGAAELLMAAGAAPAVLLAGAVGGVALLAAAWSAPPGRALAALVLLGLPFAVLAWTAVLPVVLLLTATAFATALAHRPLAHRPLAHRPLAHRPLAHRPLAAGRRALPW